MAGWCNTDKAKETRSASFAFMGPWEASLQALVLAQIMRLVSAAEGTGEGA